MTRGRDTHNGANMLKAADVDDPIARSAVSLFYALDGLDLPKGTKLRGGGREGVWITEPGKEPYLLKPVKDA